jgi:Asp/Glu/hydantoin racemase
MPRLLLINANTTRSVTDLIEHHARQAIGGQFELRAVTAAFGAPYVSTEAAYAVAGHAALDCLQRHAGGCDAVLLACFGDPGLFALREASKVPVLGMAEACMAEAAAHGRFSIVTGGLAWKPMLERLAVALGFGDALASVRALPLTGPALAADPSMIPEAARKAADEDGARTVIIGGAALAGIAGRIAATVDVPLIDSVACSARAVANLCSRS